MLRFALPFALSIVFANNPAAAEEPSLRSTSRNQLGVQVGGSGGFQLSYRFRALGPVHLEAGFFAIPHVVNGSLGAMVELRREQRVGFYASAGVAVLASGDESEREFGYARVGAVLRLGQTGRHRLTADVGGWAGNEKKYEGDVVTSEESFVTPMAGLGYHIAF